MPDDLYLTTTGWRAASVAIGCRVYHSVNQAITTATFTALAFNSERFDTDAIHSTVTNNSWLTCTVAGKYLITGQYAFAANATGLRIISIRLNGATYIAEASFAPVSGTETEVFLTTVYDLAVGDYVELIAYQTSGGNLNVEAIAQTGPVFTMMRLG